MKLCCVTFFFFFWKTKDDLEKSLLFWENIKTGTLLCLASEDGAVQSVKEMDGSGMMEPAAAEDTMLAGFMPS